MGFPPNGGLYLLNQTLYPEGKMQLRFRVSTRGRVKDRGAGVYCPRVTNRELPDCEVRAEAKVLPAT